MESSTIKHGTEEESMLRRVTQLLALMILVVLPVWASHSAYHCYTTCVAQYYSNECDGLPPEDEQMCSAHVREMCRCNCGYLTCD